MRLLIWFILLALIYAERTFLQPEKIQKAFYTVLTKEFKVQSTAIRKMRQEVKKMLNNIQEN